MYIYDLQVNCLVTHLDKFFILFS